MTFRIIHDLEALTDEQRRDYAAAVSEFIGLDPALNGLDYFWMNEGTGFRKLVLYARRGITDILRDKRGIKVTGLTQVMLNGSLVTTVTGEDSTGRQEISVGSMYIQGLTGKKLDDAIMTSQTRACRRLTLQFVGGGILDESEVGDNVVHVCNHSVRPPVQPAVQPVVPVNHAPGSIQPVVQEKGGAPLR